MDYEVIVVGGGIVGSATAYHLAKEGRKTLILEQFTQPHKRGSSYGQVRILRKAYSQPHYREMMEEAVPMWEAIEKEADTKLMEPCEMLMHGEEGSAPLLKAEETLQESGVIYEALSSADLQARFPRIHFERNHGGVLEHQAGVFLANKMLPTIQTLFTNLGGHISDKEGVTHIEPGEVVRVETTKGQQYSCKSLVLTPGPWANQLLKPLGVDVPIELRAISTTFWKRKPTDGDEWEALVDSPMIAALAGSVDEIHPVFMYGLPEHDFPYHLKADMFDGRPIDLDSAESCKVNEDVVKSMKKTIKRLYRDVEDSPSVVERGIISVTPDGEIILDSHPKWENIIIGAGFSGHGYKLAPVVGKILGQLATGIKPKYDISALKMDRFNK